MQIYQKRLETAGVMVGGPHVQGYHTSEHGMWATAHSDVCH